MPSHSLKNPMPNRKASHTANLMLNNLFKLPFVVTGFGLLKRGFDPMAGIVHADKQNRDSFACDVMEAIRPRVDDWLLEFIQRHEFTKKDFYEKRDGGIRLTLKITPILTETISYWSADIDDVINQVEGILLNHKSIDQVKQHKKRRK
jgi:CRISPR/Cas system-associated endonuclease Cas1